MENNSALYQASGGDRDDAMAMRRELSAYLDDVRHKIDDEGKPLFSYPKNFDSIADAMDRGDLVEVQEKPWSRYLLEHNVDAGEFEQGRYGRVGKGDQEDKDSLQRGLAEIEMLDRQLRAATKKQHKSRGDDMDSGSALTLQDAHFGDIDRAADSAPDTGRSSAASSRYGGRTFLTRLKSDINLGDESRQNSARSHAAEDEGVQHRFTPRSRKAAPSGPDSPSLDLADSLMHDGPKALEGGIAGLERPPPRPEATEDGLQPKKNYLEENRNAVQGRSRLNPEAQLRVNDLLGFNDMEIGEDDNIDEIEKLADEKFEAEWSKISEYGFSSEERKYMADLDSRLANLRPQPITAPPSAPQPPSSASGTEPATDAPQSELGLDSSSPERKGKHKPNYLIAQRAERTREAYVQQIDLAIRSLKRPMTADSLSALVDNSDGSEEDEGSGGGAHGSRRSTRREGSRRKSNRKSAGSTVYSREGGMSRSHSIRDLPAVEDVSPAYIITMAEVLGVIEELCHPEEQETSLGREEELHSRDSQPDLASNMASRAELDALLGKLRPDIIQLATLRNQRRDQASRQHIQSATSQLDPPNSSYLSVYSAGVGGTDLFDDLKQFESIPVAAPLGVKDIARHAAEFAEQSAAAAAALSAQHKASVKKSKSSKMRSEVVKGAAFDPRDFNSTVIKDTDFDLSRKTVADELKAASIRPSIRMRAEQSTQAAGRVDVAERAVYEEDEEVIYSAPSSAQSARSVSREGSGAPFYQSSRRQQAVRDQVKSREGRVAESAVANSTNGFLPSLPGTSPRPGSGSGTIKTPKQDNVSGQKTAKKEPQRKIGSKFNTAVIKPEYSTTSESPLKAMRHPVDINTVAAVGRPNEIGDLFNIQPAPEYAGMKSISSGLDDAYSRLNRLLARADRAHDHADDDYLDGGINGAEDEEDRSDEEVDDLAGTIRDLDEDEGSSGVVDNAYFYKEMAKDGEFVVI